MTDMERFIEVYASVGITLTPREPWRGGASSMGHQWLAIYSDVMGEPMPHPSLAAKVESYGGFYTAIVFDQNGAFVKQLIYE